MSGFFSSLHEALRRGPVVLATVLSARGSTPRIAGARQFLAADGSIAGTIGGGATEARGLELMHETLADGRPRTFSADLRGRPGDVREGVCGGTMEIGIVRLQGDPDREILAALESKLRAGKRVTLATRIVADSPLSFRSMDHAFVEILEPSPRLLIAGAGHIGRALAPLAAGLDFVVEVQDDRPEWLVPAAFPPACALQASLDDSIAALRDWEGARFATLVTRGFPQDVEALNALASAPAMTYVGLLGSHKRVATVLAAQRDSGGATLPAEILHAPIGLEIGAETPGEIAVSIAAELIRVRRRDREAAVRSAA